MGEFNSTYQIQIDMMLEYRKQYEDEITEGEHLIVQNRVRKAYLGEVNNKIRQLERERNAMNNAESGIEMVMMHQTFNGHAPFFWGNCGNDSRPSFKVVPLPLYKEVLQLNIDIINEYNAKTHVYPNYIYHYFENNTYFQRLCEVLSYKICCIREDEVDNYNYDSLKKLVNQRISSMVQKGEIEVFYSLLPTLYSNDSDLENPFHEWWFNARCSILIK